MSDWTRHGECNGCGDCCQMIGFNITFIAAERLSTAYQQARGFTGNPPRLQAHAFAPCQHHDNQANICRIHEDKPDECRTFPTAPDQIVSSRCSYWFERTVVVGPDGEPGFFRECLGGNGSPYPAVDSKQPPTRNPAPQ